MQQQGDKIVREILYQLDVLASKIRIEGSFEGDTFSEKQNVIQRYCIDIYIP